jgi:hypothetical protein
MDSDTTRAVCYSAQISGMCFRKGVLLFGRDVSPEESLFPMKEILCLCP